MNLTQKKQERDYKGMEITNTKKGRLKFWHKEGIHELLLETYNNSLFLCLLGPLRGLCLLFSGPEAVMKGRDSRRTTSS